jgi:hypothetical protein
VKRYHNIDILQQFKTEHNNNPYVFHHPIAYRQAEDRANWREYLKDEKHMATFSEFVKGESKMGKKACLALSTTTTKNIIKYDWDPA